LMAAGCTAGYHMYALSNSHVTHKSDLRLLSDMTQTSPNTHLHVMLTLAFLCCSAVTENTRASYPIHYIDNARIPCVGPHPKNLILLCCDAFGVLPPVSKLTKEQAMYHFISGYTAKVSHCLLACVNTSLMWSRDLII